MTSSELNEKNYRRIAVINWLMAFPLLVLFSWPYLYIAGRLQNSDLLFYAGSLLFASAFTLTILHGHVTMALGSLHRHHYYRWLQEHPLTYGVFFHPMITRTRFRLILLLGSLILLVIPYLTSYGS